MLGEATLDAAGPLLLARVQAGHGIRVVAECGGGVGPELELGYAGGNGAAVLDVHGEHVVGEELMPAPVQQTGERGLAPARAAQERYRAPVESDPARVKHETPALVQQDREHWAEEEEPQNLLVRVPCRMNQDVPPLPYSEASDAGPRKPDHASAYLDGGGNRVVTATPGLRAP